MKSRDVATTACIALTSLTAGSIFCFPLFGPALTRDLGLSLTQTNLIWSGAVLGEYISAAGWGVVGDHYGPRVLSIASAILFCVGYQIMARVDLGASNNSLLEVSAPEDGGVVEAKAIGSFVITVAAFVGVGSGVASSYFAAVTASTRLFTSKPGLAIAGPLTLFSLSSLFLTSFGTRFFTDAETGDLNASSFLSFLGWFLGAANLISAVFMRPPPVRDQRPLVVIAEPDEADERTALLGQHDSDPQDRSVVLLPGVPESQGILAFIGSPSVWALGLLMVVGVGASEMVMSSVGNMVVSLLGTSNKSVEPPRLLEMVTTLAGPAVGIGPIALKIRANQVKLLAIANTVARLSGGLMSDLLAPSPKDADSSRRSDGQSEQSLFARVIPQLARIRISRVTLLLLAILIGFAAYAWAAFGLTSTQGLPAFSLMVGISYGLIFSLVPAITCTAFGPAHFGRNWGLLSYCCALGSFAYSLLYATVSDYIAMKNHDHDGGRAGNGDEAGKGGATCLAGPKCFQMSFVVAMIGSTLAFAVIFPVWRRWRNHL